LTVDQYALEQRGFIREKAGEPVGILLHRQCDKLARMPEASRTTGGYALVVAAAYDPQYTSTWEVGE